MNGLSEATLPLKFRIKLGWVLHRILAVSSTSRRTVPLRAPECWLVKQILNQKGSATHLANIARG